MRLALRTRDFLLISLLTLVVVITTSFVHLGHACELVIETTRRRAEDAAHSVVRLTESEIDTGARNGLTAPEAVRESEALKDLMATLLASEGDIVYVAVVGAEDGTPLAQEGRPPDEGVALPLDELESLTSPKQLWLLGSGQLAEVAVPLERGDGRLVEVRVGVDTSLTKADVHRWLWDGAWLLLFGVFGAWLISLLVASFTRRPLRRLAEQIDRLRRGEWDFEIRACSDREVNELCEQLEALGTEIESDRLKLLGEKETLQQIMDRLENGILLVDDRARVTFSNRAFAALLSRPGPEAVGEPADRVLDAGHPVLRLLATAIEDGEPTENLQCRLSDDGRFEESLASVFPVGDDPAMPRGWVVLLQDLHSFRLLQDLAKVGKRLSDQTATTAAVVHDVKNPLHATKLWIELLDRELRDPPESVRDALSSIAENVDAIDRLISGFLDYVRGGSEPRSRFDLAAVLHDIVQRVERDTPSEIRIRLQTEDRLFARGDEEMLRRALLNLLTNSVEAMPDGGEVRVELHAEGSDAIVMVEDDGAGMSPEVLDQVFHLYFTTKTHGTGIGLPFVRRVLAMHGGTVEVSSEPGQGTSVVVRLPRGDALAEAESGMQGEVTT